MVPRLSIIILLSICFSLNAQTKSLSSDFVPARLKYAGGGDWYNDPSIIPNLMKFLSSHTNISVAKLEEIVEISDQDLFSYPVIFMTGHGQISFTREDADRLRTYLTSGGFLYADDDYGMDRSFRHEMKKVFPGKELVEVPFSHEIFHSHFTFDKGAPKIHEHDGGPPKSFGLFHENRMVVFYTINTNISDGWADPNVHSDPPEVRQKAMEMGTNIMVYALTN